MADVLSKGSLTREERARVSSVAGIPSAQVPSFVRYVQGELAFSIGIQEVEAHLESLNLGTILYLPTYRRIEKDIQSIFPDIEERLKEKLTKTGASQRQGQNFIEISGFGMSDIQQLIDKAVDEVREFRRASLESAYQEYIRDIVRGRIKKYSLTKLRSMSEGDFEEFRVRLNADIFTSSDQRTLDEKISKLRKRSTGQPSSEGRFLGMFVEQLIEAHTRTKAQEQSLNDFMAIITKYLRPAKFADFKEDSFRILQLGGPGQESDSPSVIALEHLSSGEKQIVALFAYLFLSKRKRMLVLIDEPELSLSVPWQKTFLTDILSSSGCAGLLTVTHSPFVFDNSLRDCVIDVRKLSIDHG